jgi:transcription elongation GreA/GreB family factor
MNKEEIRDLIVAKLTEDHRLLLLAAKKSHAAATHEENVPDNKYETLALEASYVAQGQANRAQEIDAAVKCYRQLSLQRFDEETPLRLTALVELEATDGTTRLIFLGPDAGGLQISYQGRDIRVVTPNAPLGRSLIGSRCGDFAALDKRASTGYEIVNVW